MNSELKRDREPSYVTLLVIFDHRMPPFQNMHIAIPNLTA